MQLGWKGRRNRGKLSWGIMANPATHWNFQLIITGGRKEEALGAGCHRGQLGKSKGLWGVVIV